MNQAAFTEGRFGVMNQTGDFEGKIYFDQIVLDDARLYPPKRRPQDALGVANQTLLFT